MEQEISFADAAAQHNLDGIHTAGIVFGNTDHLLVIGKADSQQLHGIFGSGIADPQTAAAVTVEIHAFFPKIHISSAPFPRHIHS